MSSSTPAARTAAAPTRLKRGGFQKATQSPAARGKRSTSARTQLRHQQQQQQQGRESSESHRPSSADRSAKQERQSPDWNAADIPPANTADTDRSNMVSEQGSWYSGMLSMLGGSSGLSEAGGQTGSRQTNGSSVCGSRDVHSPTSVEVPGDHFNGTLAGAAVMDDDNEESREDPDEESVGSEDVSSLGRGLGDDLRSLPSIQGSIVGGEDASIVSLDNVSLHADTRGTKLYGGTGRDRQSRTETVESVVEKKISNLKSERSSQEDTSTVPFLRRKMFPKISGRSGTAPSEGVNQENVLETRRQMLVTELRQTIETHGRWDVRCANITAALGDLYEENREYKQAIKLHNDALSVYSIKLGDDHRTTMIAKERLAEIHENASDYDAAIGYLHAIMCMTKATKGDKDPAVSDVMTKIAAILKKKGRYELAIKTLKRALKIYRDVLGDSHPKVSATVDSIASLYVTIGDFTKASAILKEVVKLKAATIGVNSKEVASSLCELATCYECAEQYCKAMKNLKKAYKIYADINGESGEKAILTLERIALIYQATGQFKKAAIAYLGVLRGRKRALGDVHPTVADTYFHLGVSLRESCQQEKALKCMKQALNIYVGEGKDMHDVEMIAEVMHELAIIHRSNNSMSDAIKTFKQEIAVRRKLGQPEYPLIAQTLNHLGVAEFDIKNYNRALNYFMEALTIYEKRGTEVGIDFAEVLYNTGLVFEAIRNKARAYDAFLEAARIFTENGYESDHPHLARAAKKLRKHGHTCKCAPRAECTNVPCTSLLGKSADGVAGS